jgi:integrase
VAVNYGRTDTGSDTIARAGPVRAEGFYMAGMAGKRVGILTARTVQAAKTPGLFGDGGNLYLNVDHNGNKSWIVRWSSGGKLHKCGLGAVHTVTLEQAREKAADARRIIRDGGNPREARREARQAVLVAQAKSMSFDDAAKAYVEGHKAGWSDKHGKQWPATLTRYTSPVFGNLPVSAIDTGMVMRVLQPIWSSKNETASRLRGRIETVLSWARVQGYRSGENPALWKGHLDHLLPARGKVHKVVHHAALPYAKLPAFMRDLRKRYGVAVLALEFAILTATRTSETLDAQWSEFDLRNKLWTIPAERMKGGREHRVPLSDRAAAIVQEMQTVRNGDYVFPGAKRGKPLSNMSMLLALRRMERDDLTTHGFRATFRTWAAEKTAHQREVIEAALAHVVGDKTENAYQRGDLLDKRRRLMDAWAAYCDSRAASNVVAIR